MPDVTEGMESPSEHSHLLNALISRIQAWADNAYCDYIGHQRRDECLGWEAKVDQGKFGINELEANKAAAERLGRHRAYAQVVRELNEVKASLGIP